MKRMTSYNFYILSLEKGENIPHPESVYYLSMENTHPPALVHGKREL
jgi:hypothetical protein